ncbi:hypothetical protein AX774_g1651 [Zancudomyces culisetae]|uniref:Uncharacterized protein n=1 Tax=Zancudomyces culisetae TaxID=1213189 RepID=A0A1R1PV24_ZANCU|nr:hypothetical protein AX774_g1651 [Zancudomyces culisetae]|eukprot:OMH84818.1 hypothetical protein AX774_g1651 [Zancudomyces culisetae]
MILMGLMIPLTFLIDESWLAPRVCSKVFAQSTGLVIAAATPPDKAPAVTWVNGEYLLSGFIDFLKTSYNPKCIVWNGRVMSRVVG